MIRRTLRATKAATFSIDLANSNKNGMPTPTGTGFFVSPDGWFVTAAHVVTQNDAVRTDDVHKGWLMAEGDSGDGFRRMCQGLKVEFIEPSLDFALLKIDFLANSNSAWLKGLDGFPYIEVSSRTLDEGEAVYAFGYPLSEAEAHDFGTHTMGLVSYSPRTTSAMVSALLDRLGPVTSSSDPQVYVLDKALNFGNSGGPILASATGRVHAFCCRFQPVFVAQPHIDPKLNIRIPSLYSIVYRLSNPGILAVLKEYNIPVSEE
jgi:serine protease Do